MQDRNNKIEQARRYIQRCESAVTNAMHSDEFTFRNHLNELNRAKRILAELENS